MRSRASPTRCARSSSTATARCTTGTSSTCRCPVDQPRQTEFARLELTHTVTSKRRLAQLVADGVVDGWDDPRMPTLRGLRRRGYPAAAIRAFCTLHRRRPHQQPALRSNCSSRSSARELNRTALRRMAVLRPLRLVITNWPDRRRRRTGRRASRASSTTPRTPTTACARCRSRRVCSSSATTSWPSRAAEVLPAHARPRGAPARRVPRDVHRLRQGRRRQRRRGALHVRPGHLAAATRPTAAR